MVSEVANICWIIEKAREFQKKIYFCFIDYAKAFDCVDHNKLWKILKEMGIPDHLTCLLRNLRTFRSDQINLSVRCYSFRPHESQHARPPCPSPTPRVYQTHVHRFSDAIHPSHPLLFPSPPAPNPSQHQSLFQWVNSLHEVAKVLEFRLQHHSFQRNPRADLLQNGLVGSPLGH